jgi:hypothetical protein
MRPIEAVRALRDRGIDNAEDLLEHATPDAIIRTCEWWDRQTGVGTGLLVSKVRKGGMAEELTSADGLTEKQRKLLRLRAKFEELTKVFVPGAVAEAHAALISRRKNDAYDSCDGNLIVVSVLDDSLAVRCDACRFDAAYSLRLAVAVLPSQPAAVGRELPSTMPPPRTADMILERGRDGGLRRLDPAKASGLDPAVVASQCDREQARAAA